MYEDLYFTKPTGEIIHLSELKNWLIEIQKKAQYEGLNNVTDYTPGSQADHALHQQALVMFSQLERINESEYNILPFNMKGEYLDYWGNAIGVNRNKATYSTGVLLFTLDDERGRDTIIRERTVVTTEDNITFVTDEDAIIPKGELSVQVKATCELAGIIGNVNAETINEVVTDYGISMTVINPNPFTGGIDEETDDHYRERILAAHDNYPPGSKGWYEAVANTSVNMHDSYCITRPMGQTATVELVFNCKNKDEENIEETLSSLKTLFNSDKYNIAGIYMILTPATTKYVFTQDDDVVRVLVAKGYTFEAVKNEVTNVIKQYFDSRTLGQEYDTKCLQFLIETLDGVAKASIDEDKQECSVYEVFTTNYDEIPGRIIEVQI